MSVEYRLTGFEPVEPPAGLRERVLALEAERPTRVRRMAWRMPWPVAAAAALLIGAVIVNGRIDGGLAARVAPSSDAAAGHPSQAFSPHAPLPATACSWSRLRQKLAKEMS